MCLFKELSLRWIIQQCQQAFTKWPSKQTDRRTADTLWYIGCNIESIIQHVARAPISEVHSCFSLQNLHEILSLLFSPSQITVEEEVEFQIRFHVWKKKLSSLHSKCQGHRVQQRVQLSLTEWRIKQGGVKSTPNSPRLQVGVISTDPEPAKEKRLSDSVILTHFS